MTQSDVETRFWAKVEKGPGCWSWTASSDGRGYGMLKVYGAMRKAHRVSYEINMGPIPHGMVVDHKCHNPGCVNPEHLRLATVKQNAENRAGAQANSSTGIRGVTRVWRSSTWRAMLNHHGRQIHVGNFPTAEEANAAVIAKRNELYTHNQEAAADAAASLVQEDE